MLDDIGELDSVTEPVCVSWATGPPAPPPMPDDYRAVCITHEQVEVHSFPASRTAS